MIVIKLWEGYSYLCIRISHDTQQIVQIIRMKKTKDSVEPRKNHESGDNKRVIVL